MSVVFSPAKKVVMFQAKNGQLYPNEDQCNRVNYMLELSPNVNELIQTALVFGEPMTVESVSNWMIQSADKIVELLSPLLASEDEPVVRRKRRTKAEMAAEKEAGNVTSAASAVVAESVVPDKAPEVSEVLLAVVADSVTPEVPAPELTQEEEDFDFSTPAIVA